VNGRVAHENADELDAISHGPDQPSDLDERVVRLGFNILTERFEIDGFDRFVEARDVAGAN